MLRVLVLLLAFSTGCIPAVSPHVFRIEAPTTQQIASCKSTRTWHNIWIVLGAFFGAGSGLSGALTPLVTGDQNAPLGLGIASAASGGVAALMTALAGVSAETYSLDDCQTILEQAANQH